MSNLTELSETLNKEINQAKKQINYISVKEVNLDFIERFSRKIYLNPDFH